MSTRPVDSVFGVQGPPADTRSGAATSDTVGRPTPDTNPAAEASESDVDWVNSELVTIASTIEQLQSRLEEANTRLASAAKVETTEYEIGRLFVEAQRFSETSLVELDVKIDAILCEAEAKAKQILTEATQEAKQIVAEAAEEAHPIRLQAHQAVFASTTARELQSAIAGFTAVNGELLKELGALNSMFAPGGEQGTGELGSPSGLPESD